ncbi:ABC transporter ATP-binding protein [Lactovum miscens]|uniref:ABC-type bacteriocin/lantibiotic exporter with double-glycine peptidase domain n=1 Tax=Lactovum miscens TaxID=190387 RepID=A0A841C7A8_9LACT|nr:ABC transporter ATP-binding protein [Lactovum miscens]MBB5888187.1 ABC-type bacteriocin/lantibiotic exporter with double-glycine peptidase domain [Lactovum miscens]
MKINYKNIFVKHKFLLFILGIFIFLQVVVSTVFPYITKFIIDNVLVSGHLQNLRTILIITMVLVVSLIPINVAISYFSSKWLQLIIFDFRQKIAERFLDSKENSKNNGLFINTIINDCEVIGNQLLSILLNSIPNILLIILYMVVLLSLDLKLTLLILLTIPVFVFVSYITSKKVFTLSKKLQEYRDRLIGFLNAYVRNKLLIDLYKLKDVEQKEFTNSVEQVKDVNIKTNTILSFLGNISGLLTVIIPLITLFFGSLLVVHHQLSLGSLVAFNSYSAMLFLPVGKLLDIPALFSQMKVSIARIESLNFSSETYSLGEYKFSTLKDKELLFVKNFIPYVEHKALFTKRLSFSLLEEDILRISGSNGVGKSILLKTLVGYHENFEGEIKKKPDSQIVYVPQENFLFDGTIKDNMIKGIESYETDQLLRLINTLSFELPLSQEVSSVTIALSSGQLQKIKLIRALLSKPNILILDEVLSNLEDSVVFNFISYIKEMKMTTIFIYHGNFDLFLNKTEYHSIDLNLYIGKL